MEDLKYAELPVCIAQSCDVIAKIREFENASYEEFESSMTQTALWNPGTDSFPP